jgi:protein ImuB
VLATGVRGRVLESAGPWRTSGDWWIEDAWSRDEWDVALSDGALYLLYRDRYNGAWFVEGAYD